MRNDIFGIAKNFLDVKAGLKVESAAKKSSKEDITVRFMDLMGQNQLSSNANVSADVHQTVAVSTSNDSAAAAYDTYRDTPKSVSMVVEKTPEEVVEEVSEPLEAYEEEIRAILKEELGVTDEQIDAALESLGMTLLDVQNVQNLAALVQTMTGEDIGTLFLSEPFQNVMQQVSFVTEAVCAELGLSKEDFHELCEVFQQAKPVESEPVESVPEFTETIQDEDIAPVLKETVEVPVTEETNVSATEETNVPIAEENKIPVIEDSLSTETPVTEDKLPNEQIEVVVQEEETMQEQQSVSVQNTQEQQEENTSKQAVIEFQEEAEPDTDAEADFHSNEQTFTQHSKEMGHEMFHTGVTFAEQHTAMTQETVLPQEAVPNYSSQIDAFELIEQIAKNVRVTISAQTTSMEMQLNPEHLGKIYLNVTEKEGAVRAQLVAQNEAVKEALETQAVELRQSLHQQGVKVDAIEITVSTHEFEQNLEQNAKQEEQMQQQREENRQQTKRNLNLNDLDGLTGLMTEEEQLAASIMQDNGNQVDLTA